MVKQIFVNFPVKDLTKTKAFFSQLGFTFNPQFTDENATCMIIGENMFAMLLAEKFFKTFIQKDIADTKKTTEVITALQVDSKDEVDEMIKNALNAGGTEPRQAQDYGWMYNRAFEDLDGHLWELFFMDESKMPPEMKEKK